MQQDASADSELVARWHTGDLLVADAADTFDFEGEMVEVAATVPGSVARRTGVTDVGVSGDAAALAVAYCFEGGGMLPTHSLVRMRLAVAW